MLIEGAPNRYLVAIGLSWRKTKEFRGLCAQIESGAAAEKIANNQGKYPYAFKWIKGENESRLLAIGGGEKGIRVMAAKKVDGRNNVKMIALKESDLESIAFLYKLVSGLVLIITGSYYDSLYHAYWEGAAERADK